MMKNTRYMTRAAVVAAIYVVLVLIQIPMGELAYGPVQLRIAEGMTLLPVLEAAAVPGLFAGCLIANLILSMVSGYGVIDIVCGSLITLVAAYLTSKCKSRWLGMIPPVLLNGLLVPAYLSPLLGVQYLPLALSITGGEFLSVLIFGNIVFPAWKKAMKKA